VAGSAVGLGLMWIQNTYKVIRLAAEAYPIDYLPMKLSTGDILLVVVTTLAISFLATVFPARRAGALPPAEVLRYE
jgi:lipoprotein-releasing system permease protein